MRIPNDTHTQHLTHEEIERSIQADRAQYLSAIRGSLLGGAIGDALGYSVEFLSLAQIRKHHGNGGIQRYQRQSPTELALISDDTQMTLFTACGLLLYDTRSKLQGSDVSPVGWVFEAYRDWYTCQCGQYSGAAWLAFGREKVCWLSHLPQMCSQRAPGNTCLGALQYGDYGTVDDPINNSKGCGGVMRVAPVGLYHKGPQTAAALKALALEAANIAALTHGHPLGYIPAAGLAIIVHRAAYGGCPYGDGLYGIVQECGEMLAALFGDGPEPAPMQQLLDTAVRLSRQDGSDAEHIARLGEGWVGEEALAIAVYCCLRHPDDFDNVIIAAVNHDGDSDSTGAIAGNIIGAWLGAEAIPPYWLDNLELLDVIEEISRDLCDHCRTDESIGYRDENWLRKYLHAGSIEA